ncbi:hypothetical protein HK100_004823, partial [Physocladia obscura]
VYLDYTTNYSSRVLGITGVNANSTISWGAYSAKKRDLVDITKEFPSAVLQSDETVQYSPWPIWLPATYISPDLGVVLPVWLMRYNGYAANTLVSGNPDTIFSSSMSISQLDLFLAKLTVTTNGFIALIDGTGIMLASSLPNISRNSTTFERYPAIGNSNSLLSTAATYLAKSYGTNSSQVQSITKTSNLQTAFNDGSDDILVNAGWIYNATTGLEILILLVIPSNDFESEIRQTIKNAIIAIVVICIGGLILAISFAWFISQPLRKLTKSMEEASNFDFSVLKEGYLKERSYIREIGAMQTVFNTMLVKFAAAIKSNQNLMKGTANSKLSAPTSKSGVDGKSNVRTTEIGGA